MRLCESLIRLGWQLRIEPRGGDAFGDDYRGRDGAAGLEAEGALGFASCKLRTFTALARHFQQRGESCTRPS